MSTIEAGMSVTAPRRYVPPTLSTSMSRRDIEQAVRLLPDYLWQDRVLTACIRASHTMTRYTFRMIVWSNR